MTDRSALMRSLFDMRWFVLSRGLSIDCEKHDNTEEVRVVKLQPCTRQIIFIQMLKGSMFVQHKNQKGELASLDLSLPIL